MKCFTHLGEEAVAVCRACGRGACAACAAEVRDTVACRGRCEHRVGLLVRAEDASVEAIGQMSQTAEFARTAYAGLAVFLLLFGAGMIAVGWWHWEKLSFLVIAGGVMVAFAGLVGLAVRRLPKGLESAKDGKAGA
jgi:hypothetical protein